MNFIEAPSPNTDLRGREIDMVILHYTGMPTCQEALDRLRDPGAKVSAHYLVDLNGDCYRLAPEEKRAWHAGVAAWQGEYDINARSIGIEMVNPGHEWGYADFPDAQMNSLVELLRDIMGRNQIPLRHVLGHSDVAPRRKEDPGEKFPWVRLAKEGLAIGPYEGEALSGEDITYDAALKSLAAIGYDAPPGDHAAALLAFQRRFCVQSLGQGFDPRTKAALLAVAEKYKD